MSRRYLDPKNDIVFKRIFGEHPNILRSFLNALLPLPENGQIVSLEYLPAEQVPQLPLLKHSIVDVRCVDQIGRQFIVEMQMNWTSAFLQRVLFNAMCGSWRKVSSMSCCNPWWGSPCWTMFLIIKARSFTTITAW